MSRSALLAALAFALLTISTKAQTSTAGWPETIDLLAKERSQAQACLDLLSLVLKTCHFGGRTRSFSR
jgi:hypothetical protein